MSAPKLPLVLQQILKGYQKGTMGSFNEKDAQESLRAWPPSHGEFFAQADAFSHEAESKAKEQLALAEELALVKEQLAQQAQVFFHRETALNQELSTLRQAELETNKKLFDKSQEYTTLLAKIVPLRTQVVGLVEEVVATKARMVKLEERATEREVKLGKVEAELIAQTEALEKAKAELTIQAKVFGRAKTAGFEDALAQVACKHPEMDVSPFATSNHIVDGQIVPRRS